MHKLVFHKGSFKKKSIKYGTPKPSYTALTIVHGIFNKATDPP